MKLYTAARFAGDSEHHMTLSYYGTSKTLEEIKEEGTAALAKLQAAPFSVVCTERAMFGPRKNVPVLKCPTPVWLAKFVHLTRCDDKYPWSPHITTNLDELGVTCDRIAIMHKKEELFTWNL